jgi:hypothetical protein
MPTLQAADLMQYLRATHAGQSQYRVDSNANRDDASSQQTRDLEPHRSIRIVVWSALTVLLFSCLFVMLFFQDWLASKDWFRYADRLPLDPALAALKIMDVAPVIVCCSIIVLSRSYHDIWW